MTETFSLPADPIILPFGFTIPNPLPVASSGLPRLAASPVHPANGWPKQGV